jgi:hypothetical protein
MQRQGEQPTDLTIIIVSYNTAHLLGRLIGSIYASDTSASMQIVVVDNASSDNSVDVLRSRYPQIEVIANGINVGFGRANNQAMDFARGRYILLLNTDAFVAPDTLSKTMAYMDANPKCGVLGVRLTDEDGRVQPSCRFFPTPWNIFVSSQGLHSWFPKMRFVDDPNWDPTAYQECDWVPGCYYLIRREVTDHIGLFDPRFFLYYEEVDHCRRTKDAGWLVMYYPETSVIHLGGESAGSISELTRAARQISVLQIESELLYFRKHHGVLGAALAVALTMLSSLADAAKSAIRGPQRADAAVALRHSWTIATTARKTRLGARTAR